MAGGGSPPPYRHDGTSPLPLGMDASTAPLRWNGVHTVWPHDSRSGWSYCVMVPNWLTIPQATTSDGNAINPIVFYRVQVGIQSPQGMSTVRVVLRRFSDFLKLFAALKKAFPDKRLPAAPPKNTLMRINSSQILLQERRWALDDWMGRLLDDIDISRSVPVASFLELEAAARFAINTISEQQASDPIAVGTGPDSSNLPWAGAGSSVASGPFPSGLEYASDATNDTPVVGSLTKTSKDVLELEMEALAQEQEVAINDAADGVSNSRHIQKSSTDPSTAAMEARQGHVPGQPENLETETQRHPGDRGTTDHGNMSSALPKLPHAFSADSMTSWHRRKGSHESLTSDIDSVRGSEPSVAPSLDGQMEASVCGLGAMDEGLVETESVLKSFGILLPVDQRGKVRRVLAMMQRKLSLAKADMEDLIARLNQEKAVKEFLATKVRDLEGELDSTRRKSREVLQQAVSTERDKVTSLLWELEEYKATLMNLEESSGSDKEARQSLLDTVARAEAARETAAREIADSREAMVQLQKERDSIEAQAKANMKVLVKEIKSLRSAQPEIKKEMELALQAKVALENALHEDRQRQEKAQASRTKFLHEVATLQQRLQECSVDYLAREDERLPNKGASGVTDALDLLSTSDNRIGLLIAETQLLAQQSNLSHNRLANGVHSNGAVPGPQDKVHEFHGDGAEHDAVLQQVLTDLVIDNAQLRRAMNHSLTQSALSSQRGEKDGADGPSPRKGVLSKFLGSQ